MAAVVKTLLLSAAVVRTLLLSAALLDCKKPPLEEPPLTPLPLDLKGRGKFTNRLAPVNGGRGCFVLCENSTWVRENLECLGILELSALN